MAKVNMTAPINATVLPLDEQRRTLEGNLQSFRQGVERQKMDFQAAEVLGDTARMESARLAAEHDLAMAEQIEVQLAALPKIKAAAVKSQPKRKAKK